MTVDVLDGWFVFERASFHKKLQEIQIFRNCLIVMHIIV